MSEETKATATAAKATNSQRCEQLLEVAIEHSRKSPKLIK
jgi:hypothetical protein